MTDKQLPSETEFALQELESICGDAPHETFADYIRKMRSEVLSPTGKEGLSLQEHANLLGLSKGMYQKILNKQKKAQSRDCIIAICASLHMDVEDTNTGLKMYDMPSLDSTLPRDEVIIDVLNGAIDDEISIETINRRLIINGMEQLKIINHRYRSEESNRMFREPIFPYKLIKKSVTTIPEVLIRESTSDSLSTTFSFSSFTCHANMHLLDPITNCRYILGVSQCDRDYMYNLFIFPNGKKDKMEIHYFENTKDSGEFIDCYADLQALSNREQKRMESFLNDTRNYRERLGAGIFNSRIHIFYEIYNYSAPELNEYYLFEYIDGIYRLTVTNRSLFMQKQLSESEYTLHYGKPCHSCSTQYDSLEEIETFLSNANSRADAVILSMRIKAYKSLRPIVETCLEDLRNRKKYVRHPKSIGDSLDNVCLFYEVTKEFQCSCDDKNENVVFVGAKSALFPTSNGNCVEITLEDLHSAYELGFQSIKEICQVKYENGSIESVLC